jgi:glycerol-3-phosphate acyltransferase PlsX
MLNNVKIAIDAMGSDHGPSAIVSGAALSKQRNPGSQYIFFGDKKIINAETAKYDILDNSYEIIDTKETISPADKPSQALRKMKNTSMGMSLEYLSKKNVDAVFLQEILEL